MLRVVPRRLRYGHGTESPARTRPKCTRPKARAPRQARPTQSRQPSQAPSDMSQRQGEGVQRGAGRSVATVERQRRDPARRAGPSSLRRCPARHAAPRRCRASGATVRPSRAGRARRGRDRESRCHYETPPDCAARTNRMQHPAYVCYHEPRHKNGEHPRQRMPARFPRWCNIEGSIGTIIDLRGRCIQWDAAAVFCVTT